MTEAFCRRRWATGPVITTCALAVLLTAPTTASACPAYAKVKAFHGFGSATFVESASGSDSIGGPVSISLDHQAAGIQFPSVSPAAGGHDRVFTDKAEGVGKGGGFVYVHDSYTQNDSPGPVTLGAQTADGPTVTGKAEIGFSPDDCNYEVSFGFGIATAPSGTWPSPPDHGVTGIAFSPVRPIPANLKLSGSVTVNVNANPTSRNGEVVRKLVEL